jgi:hypothetical protein
MASMVRRRSVTHLASLRTRRGGALRFRGAQA